MIWELHRVGARWLVDSVRRDPATDAPLPPTPQARASPEGVVKAALRALADGDTWQVPGVMQPGSQGCLKRLKQLLRCFPPQ